MVFGLPKYSRASSRFVITTEIQQPILEDVGLTRGPGVCGLDGHSQAPRDGLTASRAAGEADIGFKAED